ncbi:MAG: type II and III secretion system protein family protein [Proteobacteria bacterium]|nr:type II and III secretion system protein family protein [Pseudomonadota bacterium]
MVPLNKAVRSLLLGLGVVVLLAVVLAFRSSAQPAVTVEILTPGHAGEFIVPLNKSQILRLNVPYTDLSIGNPKIADVLPITTKQIYVLGKEVGLTNLLVYGEEGALLAVLDLVVTYDVEGLKQRLFELLPNEKIGVRAVGSSVVLTGTVSKGEKISQVLAIAERFAPKQMVNMLTLKGSQQVMLAVRFAEISRSASKALGLQTFSTPGPGAGIGDFTFRTGAQVVKSLGDTTTTIVGGGITTVTSAADDVSALFLKLPALLTGVPFFSSSFTRSNFSLFFDALETKGLVKTLAEPNLMALSGETASFLAGGEFPIPTVESVGEGGTAQSVEFKEFGISLAFTPTVLENGRISLVVTPEASTLDLTIAATIGNTLVPGLKTRRVTTTIELGDGQSFTIAGLLENNYSNNIGQFPWLGDLPIIGALFRSTEFQRNETELVILVTPYLVKPAKAGTLIGAADLYKPPSDVDLFIHGRLDAPGSGMPQAGSGMSGAQGAGGISGPYGHIIK